MSDNGSSTPDIYDDCLDQEVVDTPDPNLLLATSAVDILTFVEENIYIPASHMKTQLVCRKHEPALHIFKEFLGRLYPLNHPEVLKAIGEHVDSHREWLGNRNVAVGDQEPWDVQQDRRTALEAAAATASQHRAITSAETVLDMADKFIHWLQTGKRKSDYV